MMTADPIKSVRMNVPEMLDFINNTGNKGAKIVSIVAKTYPEMNKKNRITKEPNPYTRGVSRLVHRNLMLGVNYETAVNRQRLGEVESQIAALEADALMDPAEKAQRIASLRQSLESVEMFHAEALWRGYGVKVEGQPYLVTHKTKGGLYFATKPYQVPTNSPESITGTYAPMIEETWVNEATNAVVDPAILAPYLPPPRKASNQGLEHDVQWRVYGIAGGGDGTAGYVLQIRYAGKHIIVNHE